MSFNHQGNGVSGGFGVEDERPDALAAGGDGANGRGRLGRAFLRRRKTLLIAAHCLLFAGAFLLAVVVRREFALPTGAEWSHLGPLLLVVLGLKLGVFLALGSHAGWWRYATFVDLIAIVEASTIASALVGVVNLGWPWMSVPRSVILIDWCCTILIVGGLRASTRFFRERYFPMIAARSPERVLLVGTSEESLAIVRSIQTRPDLNMKVVGYLDADPRLHGRVLAGTKVVGSPAEAARLAAAHRAGAVLVPTPTVPPSEVRALVDDCCERRIKVQMVPVFHELLKGNWTIQPRDVDIEDLLSRDAVQLDGAGIDRFLHGKVVMVTGAAGSIGSEICRQTLVYRPSVLILLDHSENGLFHVERELRGMAGGTTLVTRIASIRDIRRLRDTFEKYHPQIVFHAAAYKHVPMMESNPSEAVKNNVFGTRVLVDEAVRAGVDAFVMISTDKAVKPSSVMGACKRLAEMYVHAVSGHSSTRMVTVRFGNVLGSNGSVVPLFKEQLRRGLPLTVTHPEMTRYFMTIPEASQLVLQAGALGKGGEIFVLDMGQPVRIVDLARDIIRLSGFTEGREARIAFTGLRPGEKLHEELYDPDEERLPTPHPKIFTAKHRPAELAPLLSRFEDLWQVVMKHGEAEVVASLQGLIPEYRPRRPEAAPTPSPAPATAPEPPPSPPSAPMAIAEPDPTDTHFFPARSA